MTLLTALAETASAAPQRTAYCIGEITLTYEQLWRQVQRTAALLRRQGTSPVLLWGEREAWMLVSMLACLLCKRTYVPISSQTPPARLAFIAAQTDATLLLCDRPTQISGVDCRPFSALEAFSNEAPQPEPEAAPAYILFTSGSTGQPKGVPISRENLQNFSDWICALPAMRAEHPLRVLGQAGFSFDLSLADTVYALCGGHTLIGFDAQTQSVYPDFTTLLSTADVAVMTPTMLRMCLADSSVCEENMPRLRRLYLCGEVFEVSLAQRLFRAFPKLCVLNAYGPTEATSAVCAAVITPELAQNATLLPIAAADTFATEVAVEDGEIVLRGKSVFSGYLNARNAELPQKGYPTGDLGFWQDGMLFCKGRKDTQIKYKGYRIELCDIEENLSALQNVRGCAVVAKKDAFGNVRLLKAFVEMDESLFSAPALKKELSARLPSYMIPKVLQRIDALPVNQNGKINRKELETWN